MGVNLSSDQSLLLNHFKELSAVDQKSRLSFAEFLPKRDEPNVYSSAYSSQIHHLPELLPRLSDETIRMVIKRLSLSYPMLQDTELLHQCSALMNVYVLKGRAAPNVIDKLELLFRQSIRKLSE